MMKISVLMPIYNTKEEYLRASIESILNQTYSDFEFLIYDDNSTCDLYSIVCSYKDDRIIYKRMDRNYGISGIRNLLVNDARGEYLAIMDHDDIRLPTSFMKEVDFLDKNPKYGVVGSWHGFVGSNKISRRPVLNKQIKISMFHDCPLHHPTTMIRKSVFSDNDVTYNEHYSPAEDYFLWARLVNCTKFYNIPEVLFLYRNNYNNTTHSQKKALNKGVKEVFLYLRQNYPYMYQDKILKEKLYRHYKKIIAPILYLFEPFCILKYMVKLYKVNKKIKLLISK